MICLCITTFLRHAALEKQLDEKQKVYNELEDTLKIKDEENALLKSRYEQFCKERDLNFVEFGVQCEAYFLLNATTSSVQVRIVKFLSCFRACFSSWSPVICIHFDQWNF